jgi:hypothetical protein
MAISVSVTDRHKDSFVQTTDDKTARRVVVVDADGNPLTVNSDGQLHVVLRGMICSGCSTSTPLLAGATFTGTAHDVLDYGIIFVSAKSDVASGTDGLSLQQSPDGTNWDVTDEYTLAADVGKTFAFQPAMKYFRVVYINGASDQTYFRLQTTFKKTNSLDSSHRISDSIVQDDDARLVKSVLTARKDTGTFSNIGATASGNLRTTNAESGLAIAAGDVVDHSFVHKFGEAPDFDTTDGYVTIWDGANDGEANIMTYTYSTTADIDRVISSSAADTQDVEIQGLDTNYDMVTQTITLNGQTAVALTTSLIRVFRVKNVGTTDIAGRVSVYVNTTTTGGIPDTPANVRAIVNDGNNQTLMAVFTIPAGYTGYMRDWYASTAGGVTNATHVIRLFARPFGQVFQLKHVSSITTTGTSYIQHKYEEPEVFSEKTDIEMKANTDVNASAVATGFDIVLVKN